MLSKAFVLAAMALVAAPAIATPIAEASEMTENPARAVQEKLAKRAVNNGALILYPQPNYGGSSDAVVIGIYEHQTFFCNIWNSLGRKSINVRSYVGGDIICQLFTGPACDGDTVAYSGLNANVNFTPGSFFCIYAPGK